MTIDLDSTICEVHGKQKHGAAFGYTRVLGYHPLVATRADTGEVLHARLRKGSSQRGTKRFCEELVARVRRAGATGALDPAGRRGVLQLGPHRHLDRLGVACSITVTITPSVQGHIAAIDESAWLAIDLSRRRSGPGGRDHLRDRDARRAGCASFASSCAGPGSPTRQQPVARLATPRLLTDLDTEVDRRRRLPPRPRHVELAIRDLKEGAGLEHCPSGQFFANAAWLGCAVLAHNLIRWTARLGGDPPRRSAHRRPHRAHPSARRSRAPRQPLRLPPSFACPSDGHGPDLHHAPSTAPRPAPAHLTEPRGPAQPQTITRCADNPRPQSP